MVRWLGEKRGFGPLAIWVFPAWLALAIQLLLREKIGERWPPLAKPWGAIAWAALLVTSVFVAAWPISEFTAASNRFSLAIAASIIVAYLVGSRWPILARRPLVVIRPDIIEMPEDTLRVSILEYAERLAENGHDASLVELRRTTSRTLHLLGAHTDRVALGRLSLTAAYKVKDQLSVAEILIDDMGWALAETGQRTEAINNIQQGLRILESLRAPGTLPPEREIAYLIKGKRHLASLQIDSGLSVVFSQLDEASKEAANLGEPRRSHALAGLERARGLCLLAVADSKYGKLGHIPTDDPFFQKYEAAVTVVQSSIRRYESAQDYVRATKSARLAVQLSQHQPDEVLLIKAQADFDRLQALAKRDSNHLEAQNGQQ